MLIKKYLNRVEQFDQLVRAERSGPPHHIAKKLELSESALYAFVDDCFDISYGNTNIEKITDDSLVFVTTTIKESFRALGKGDDWEYGLLTKVTLTRDPISGN